MIFTAAPKTAFITNSRFSHIAGHAITEGFDGPFVDFKATNAFDAIAGCQQPRESKTTCPSPRPACDENR